MRIAVVSPHREDAALSLGLAVGVWLEQGHAVEVINVFTRSEYAPYSDADSLHPNDRMSFVSATRKREDESWVKQYPGPVRGKLKLTDLNVKDAPLRLHCRPEEVWIPEGAGFTVNPQDKALVKVGKALDAAKPAALVLPLALGRHIDHLTARAAGLTPHPAESLAVAFYEEMPFVADEDASGAIDAARRELTAELRTELVPAFASVAAEDVAAAVTRKRRLALCYDSQIDDAVTERIALHCSRYAGRERLWVNTAWQGSALYVAA